MSKVFIVGKKKSGKDCWEFQGVFSTEEKALKACKGHRDYFVGPAIMDEVVTDDSIDWNGAYYPAYTEVV